jgi:tRNA threonylcarbamoyladenosine biosynthesis protein TsaB
MKWDDGLFMTILALEFSSPQRSVAIARGRAGQAASVISEAVETGAGGTRAFGLIESALREAKLERGQIEVLAIGLGPGSYTGIRVALAIAQGWQLASRNGGLKVLGISSAECLAAQALAENIRGRVNVVVDAQRNEFYLAVYDIAADGWKEIEPLRILPRAEVESQAGRDAVLIGPEAARFFAKGHAVYPRAAMLGQLALRRNDFVVADKLEPIYLRETHFVKAPPGRRTVL